MTARFNRDWMNKEEYKDWLEPDPMDNTNAWCRICVKTFTLSNMGEPAVKSHAQGKKHQSAIQGSQKSSSIKEFFTTRDTVGASTSTKSGEGLSTIQPTSREQLSQMEQFVSRKDQHMAEIRWGPKNSNVTLLIKLGSRYYRCIPCDVPWQQDSTTDVLWCNKTVISYNIWDCTFLQERTSKGCE